MKQGNNFVMGIRIREGLDDVEKILFKFKQANKTLTIAYPGEKAALDSIEPDVINLFWSYADTYLFEAGKPMQLDMIIKRVGFDSTPETAIKELVMSPTLFTQAEVKAFYDRY